MAATTTRTAFVLAGGGSLGAVEVGMLRELVVCGERPDLVVGASAGALNGAYFAGAPDVDGVASLERFWRALTRRDVMPMSWRSLAGLLRLRNHLVDSTGLRRLLERHLPYRMLEQARIPIYVVASDFTTGEEVLLSAGPAVDAVLASTAIPGVFPPVKMNGRTLVDGGVANNTPISTALRLGATRILVLPTGFACALKRIPTGPLGQAMHAISLLVARQLVADIERFRDQVELYVVPPLCPVESHSYDYTACGGLIDRAAQQTRDWIARGGLKLSEVPHELREHSH